MENWEKTQERLMVNFLERHFKVEKTKIDIMGVKSKRFHRAIVGYNGIYYKLSNQNDKNQLKHHLKNILDSVFGFELAMTLRVINRYIK